MDKCKWPQHCSFVLQRDQICFEAYLIDELLSEISKKFWTPKGSDNASERRKLKNYHICDQT